MNSSFIHLRPGIILVFCFFLLTLDKLVDKYFTHSALKTCNIGASTQDFGGCIAQSIMCLTADQGVASLIPAWYHSFVEIDHEIISTVLLLSSTDSRRVVVSYKQKYVHEVLANCFNQACPGKMYT